MKSIKHIFTLIELLVTVTIIMILLGIAIGLYSYIQQQMTMNKVKSALNVLTNAAINYRSDNGMWPDIFGRPNGRAILQAFTVKEGRVPERFCFYYYQAEGSNRISDTGEEVAVGVMSKEESQICDQIFTRVNRESNNACDILDPWMKALRFKISPSVDKELKAIPDQYYADVTGDLSGLHGDGNYTIAIYSFGPDGKDGTDDDIYPEI